MNDNKDKKVEKLEDSSLNAVNGGFGVYNKKCERCGKKIRGILSAGQDAPDYCKDCQKIIDDGYTERHETGVSGGW